MFDRARVSSSREPKYLRIYPQSTVLRKAYLKNFSKITFLIPSKEVILENVNLLFLRLFSPFHVRTCMFHIHWYWKVQELGLYLNGRENTWNAHGPLFNLQKCKNKEIE